MACLYVMSGLSPNLNASFAKIGVTRKNDPWDRVRRHRTHNPLRCRLIVERLDWFISASETDVFAVEREAKRVSLVTEPVGTVSGEWLVNRSRWPRHNDALALVLSGSGAAIKDVLSRAAWARSISGAMEWGDEHVSAFGPVSDWDVDAERRGCSRLSANGPNLVEAWR